MKSVLYTIEQLVGLGAHIGNTRIYWDSTMYVYTLGLRKDIVILNMRFTVEMLRRVGLVVVELSRLRGRFMFFFSLVHALFGKAMQLWLHVDYFSGLYLGGIISNLRKVWPVLNTIAEHGREFKTSITSISYAPDFCIPVDAAFGLIGAESIGIGSISAGVVDSDMPFGKFLYSLPMNNNSLLLRFFFLRIISLSFLKGRMQERGLLLLNLKVNSSFFKNCMSVVRACSFLFFLKEMQQLQSMYMLLFDLSVDTLVFSCESVSVKYFLSLSAFTKKLSQQRILQFFYNQSLAIFFTLLENKIKKLSKINTVFLLFYFTYFKRLSSLVFYLLQINMSLQLIKNFIMLVYTKLFKSVNKYMFFQKVRYCLYLLTNISVVTKRDLNLLLVALLLFCNIYNKAFLGNLRELFDYLYNYMLQGSFYNFNYLFVEDFFFFFFEYTLSLLQDEINYVSIQKNFSFYYFHFNKKKKKSFLELRQSIISKIVR